MSSEWWVPTPDESDTLALPATVKRMRKWATSTGLPRGRVNRMRDNDMVRMINNVYRGGVSAFLRDIAAA